MEHGISQLSFCTETSHSNEAPAGIAGRLTARMKAVVPKAASNRIADQ